jgi:hypothetical protein
LKKQCAKCAEVKPLIDFHKNNTRKDGHKYYCKVCACKEARTYRKKNLKRIHKRARERARGPQEREKKAQYNKQYVKKYPEKIKAANVIMVALRSGKLTRPKTCTAIGCEESNKIQGHHHDYKKPLDVTWLCLQHHMQLHRNF